MIQPSVPKRDGDVNVYNLSESTVFEPVIHYVNGIRVPGIDHALIAGLLSLLTERPIVGIYNKTNGALVDLGQCVLDYLQNATARLSSRQNLNRPEIPESQIPGLFERTMDNSVVWNTATAKLFQSLVTNRNRKQMIVAHSQGNLITANALFVLEDMLGARVLRNIRVYSLASPAPAWPLGIRRTNGGGGRQENAFMNDLVMLLRPHNFAAKVGITRFQNEGDFRTHPGGGVVGIAAHDTKLNMALNFLKSIRGDLGLSKDLPDDFLQQCANKAAEAFADLATE
ncbi:MAG: hypothetical protein AAF802_21100 [Planctomycetota bacterium]